MASEDVIERWDRWYDSADEDLDTVMDLAEALAAEVRELRRDKARLIELFRSFAQKINVDGHHPAANAIEAICDAAMGGEAQTHD